MCSGAHPLFALPVGLHFLFFIKTSHGDMWFLFDKQDTLSLNSFRPENGWAKSSVRPEIGQLVIYGWTLI
jgi:hypothetical protein